MPNLVRLTPVKKKHLDVTHSELEDAASNFHLFMGHAVKSNDPNQAIVCREYLENLFSILVDVYERTYGDSKNNDYYK